MLPACGRAETGGVALGPAGTPQGCRPRRQGGRREVYGRRARRLPTPDAVLSRAGPAPGCTPSPTAGSAAGRPHRVGDKGMSGTRPAPTSDFSRHTKQDTSAHSCSRLQAGQRGAVAAWLGASGPCTPLFGLRALLESLALAAARAEAAGNAASSRARQLGSGCAEPRLPVNEGHAGRQAGGGGGPPARRRPTKHPEGPESWRAQKSHEVWFPPPGSSFFPKDARTHVLRVPTALHPHPSQRTHKNTHTPPLA